MNKSMFSEILTMAWLLLFIYLFITYLKFLSLYTVSVLHQVVSIHSEAQIKLEWLLVEHCSSVWMLRLQMEFLVWIASILSGIHCFFCCIVSPFCNVPEDEATFSYSRLRTVKCKHGANFLPVMKDDNDRKYQSYPFLGWLSPPLCRQQNCGLRSIRVIEDGVQQPRQSTCRTDTIMFLLNANVYQPACNF